jgi:hypothetical protein
MAAHAAFDAGDRAGAEQLLARAREDARHAVGMVVCESPEGGGGLMVGPRGDAWEVDSRMERLDLRGRRRLYGFCGTPTRDPARARRAAVSWVPAFPGARWVRQPTEDRLFWKADEAEIFDLIGRAAPLRVRHSIGGWDYNEGYDGAIALSQDRSLVATGANEKDEEVRIWRSDTGAQVQALSYRGVLHGLQSVAFSPDGSMVAAADCSGIALWEVASGKRVEIKPSRHLQCVYGGGLSHPVAQMAFSPDGGQFVAWYFVMGPPSAPVPDAEAGYWLGAWQARKGKLVSRRRVDEDLMRGFAVTADGRSIVTPDGALVDLAKGPARKVEASRAPGGLAGVSWVVASSRVWELGPGARAEGLELQRPELEPIGPYWIPKGLQGAER